MADWMKRIELEERPIMERSEMLNIIADTPCAGPRGVVGHELAEKILARLEYVTPEPVAEPEPPPEAAGM